MCVQGKGALHGAPAHRDFGEAPEAEQEAAQITTLQESDRCIESIFDVEVGREKCRVIAESRAQSRSRSNPNREQALIQPKVV